MVVNIEYKVSKCQNLYTSFVKSPGGAVGIFILVPFGAVTFRLLLYVYSIYRSDVELVDSYHDEDSCTSMSQVEERKSSGMRQLRNILV